MYDDKVEHKRSMPQSSHNQKVGKWGEEIARRFLKDKGYEIIHNNLRSGHTELDLVARHESQLIFIEVKSRTRISDNFPDDAMTPRKISHLFEAIQRYLEEHPDEPEDWKLEIVAVVGNPGNYQVELYDEFSFEQ